MQVQRTGLRGTLKSSGLINWPIYSCFQKSQSERFSLDCAKRYWIVSSPPVSFTVSGCIEKHFPHGGTVAKTPRSQCRGPRFNPWSGNEIPHAETKSLHAAAKTKHPSATTKTWQRQINIYYKKEEEKSIREIALTNLFTKPLFLPIFENSWYKEWVKNIISSSLILLCMSYILIFQLWSWLHYGNLERNVKKYSLKY